MGEIPRYAHRVRLSSDGDTGVGDCGNGGGGYKSSNSRILEILLDPKYCAYASWQTDNWVYLPPPSLYRN